MSTQPYVRFDQNLPSLVIHHLEVRDAVVVDQARRWMASLAQSAAGGAVDAESVDLTDFTRNAMVVGAHAIGAAGDTRAAVDLQALVAEVEQRTIAATKAATDGASVTATQAAEIIKLAAATAQTSIAEVDARSRKAFADNVAQARSAVTDEITRLVGGDDPELTRRLQSLLDKFGVDLGRQASQQTGELIRQVIERFDTTDPASPMSQLARAHSEQQQAATAVLTERQDRLAAKLDELTTAVTVATASNEVTARLTRATPLKGIGYADGVHATLRDIAAGLGDEYVDTSAVTGLVSRSKKGDGLLAIQGGDVKVVMEMSDSHRATWSDYLAEAERNRGAVAALGLVRSADQLGGELLLALGARRVVMVFDPEVDDPRVLRTVVQILRLAAQTTAADRSSGAVDAAEDKIGQALAALGRIETIRKTADAIRKSATKVDVESEKLEMELTRLLEQARGVLTAMATDPASFAA